ncbi:MAG: Bug family tripartite tricarboxylate transporter substrate binding protein [Burkholderiales bacterium]
MQQQPFRIGRGLILAWLAATGSAFAQPSPEWPSRPVRMIVPFAPGGASDFVGRILQPKLSEALGQQVVVDNRAGASGNIGVEMVARAAPDGYTLLLGNVGTMAINPAVFRKFPVNPLRDLIAVTSIVDVPGALAIHSSVPSNNLKEFLDYARARPNQLNYGSSGASSAQGLMMEFVMNKAGIKLTQIPYKGGAGAAAAALLAGEVSASLVSVTAFLPHVKTGRVKVIAVVAPKRVAQLPEIPTLAESGFPELTSGSWQGMYLPAGTPRAVVNKLNAVLLKVLNDPWTVERLDLGGAQMMVSKSPEEFAGFMKTQTEFWARLVKQAGVEGE